MAVTTLIKVVNLLEEKQMVKPLTNEEIKREIILEMVNKIDFKELEKVFKFGFSQDEEFKRFSVQLITKDL